MAQLPNGILKTQDQEQESPRWIAGILAKQILVDAKQACLRSIHAPNHKYCRYAAWLSSQTASRKFKTRGRKALAGQLSSSPNRSVLTLSKHESTELVPKITQYFESAAWLSSQTASWKLKTRGRKALAGQLSSSPNRSVLTLSKHESTELVPKITQYFESAAWLSSQTASWKLKTRGRKALAGQLSSSPTRSVLTISKHGSAPSLSRKGQVKGQERPSWA